MTDIAEKEIRRYLRQIDPEDFEKLIADIWEELGYTTNVTSLARDRGIDVIAIKEQPFREKILIQAKAYSNSNKIGSQEVRNYATLYQQETDADRVAIITTSTFTGPSKDLADDLDVNIVDINEIVELVSQQDTIIRKIKREQQTTDRESKSSGSSGGFSRSNVTKSNKEPSSGKPRIYSDKTSIDKTCSKCQSGSISWNENKRMGECSSCGEYYKFEDREWILAEKNPKSYSERSEREPVQRVSNAKNRSKRGTNSQKSRNSEGESECFIATAAFGTPAAEEISILRVFRDRKLKNNPIGRFLVKTYYLLSPPVADFIANSEPRKRAVRELVIIPIVRLVEKHMMEELDSGQR